MLRFDEIGYWTELKIEILRKYAAAYSAILTRQRFHHIYIDAFAGAGAHISRTSGSFVPGSPLTALDIRPPFREYHLIDLDRDKIAALREAVGSRPNVWLYEADCNEVLLATVLPRVKYEQRRRALCLLDPYGLDLNWPVIETTGRMKTVEIFLNFPVADMNRNVLWRVPAGVNPSDVQRMTAFWGDESWREAAYNTSGNLFGWPEKTTNETIAETFRCRLERVAGFSYVPSPVPMRNSIGRIVYYLFFASPNRTGAKIVEEIFHRYRAQ